MKSHHQNRIGLFVLAILLISLLPTTNAQQLCPSVYADNAGGRVFEGEIFAGATSYQLERNDWLPLPHLKSDLGIYRTSIVNESQQVQHLNLLELVVVDHPKNTEILFDKHGSLHTLELIQRPRMAIDQDGRDLQRFFADKDSLVYYGNFDRQSPDAEESLVFEFRRTHGIMEAKVVIDAKNSVWLDEAYGRYLAQYGASLGQQLNKSNDKLQKWMLDQNLPLKVWVETAPGMWKLEGWFNLAGPKTMRRDVLMIDLTNIPAETVRIKLTTGFLFWEIDRVGMDFSTDLPVLHQVVQPTKVVDIKGQDFVQKCLNDDPLYLNMTTTGDAVTAVFMAPKQHEGLKRTTFLHSKGYYDLLLEPHQNKPRPEFVESLNQPNHFPVFARDQWYQALKENKVAKPIQN
ncbi:MAG: hypothetical protein IT270_06075 [Saprospiraceae bacterium]|nr:hypothetical protein [Saprospiraceae bacterium]